MNDEQEKQVCCIVGAILGVIFFIIIYGFRVLNPTYDEWLLGKGDLTQHYLGWCFFRKGNWAFPFGLTNQLAYPSYSSVIFTDSIPVFAVLFKLLSPLLPETFQYFGLWGLLCFCLQGYFAAKILRELGVGKIQTLIGCVFFIVSPTVIEKMFRHTALAGHWLILLTIYLFVSHRRMYRDLRRTSLYWGIVGALIASIHLYYLPMCGMFLGGYLLCSLVCDYLKEHKLKLRYLLPGAAFAIGLFFNTWILGGFSSGASSEGDGLGRFSFNLNGFFNAKGYSRIFDALVTYRDGQYEGFAYLGLGIFLLILVSLFYVLICIVRKSVKKDQDFFVYGIVYVLMSLGLIIFAASPEVSFNGRLLFTVPYSSTLYHYWGMFRSTGRIVWPVCYLIYVAVILCCDRMLNKNKIWKIIGCSLLCVCVFIQIFDLSLKITEQQNNYNTIVKYDSPLQAEIWKKIAASGKVKHVVWVSNNFDNNEIMHIAKYALDNDMTMNTYYFARAININENTRQSMEKLSDDCMYLFRTVDNDNDQYSPYEFDLELHEADGYIIGTTFELVK